MKNYWCICMKFNWTLIIEAWYQVLTLIENDTDGKIIIYYYLSLASYKTLYHITNSKLQFFNLIKVNN